MIEDDRGVRVRVREIAETGELVVKDCRVERKPSGRQVPEPGTKTRALHDVGRRAPPEVAEWRVARMREGDLADAAEPIGRDRDRPVQRLRDAVAGGEIGVPDNRRAYPARTIAATGAHRRDAVGELHFADRPQHLRT